MEAKEIPVGQEEQGEQVEEHTPDEACCSFLSIIVHRNALLNERWP